MARTKTRKKSPPKQKTPEPLNRLQKFSLFFFERFRLTLATWALLLIFGAISYAFLMPREGFPSVSIPISTVTGTYFVNDNERVDREIAKPLSELIKQDERVKAVEGTSSRNFYVLQIEYNEGADPAAASRDIQKRVQEKSLLPDQATADFKPITFSVDPEGQGDNLLVAFHAEDGVPLGELTEKAAEARDFLAGSEGIQGAERVRLVEVYRTGQDPKTGKEVREQKSFDRIATTKDDLKLHTSVILAVKADNNTDELQLFDNTEQALQRLEADARFEGYGAVAAANLAEGVRSQIDSLQENLLGGLVAVLLVSFLVISVRASLVTAVSMVTVLAMTVGLLHIFGLTINTITLFALILCLGLIVDDTTIMVEAIDAGRKSKKPRRLVVAEAVRKVSRASAAGTFTTMLGFAPLLFISGILGEFIFAIPVTIIISLAVSLLVSLTLVPFLSRVLIPNKDAARGSFSPLGSLETFISSRLAALIRVGLRSRRKLTAIGISAILFSVVLTVVGGALFGKIRFNIFPSTKDTDAIQMRLRFAPGTAIKESEKITDELSQKALDSIGRHVRRASLSATGSNTSAILTLELTSFKDRGPTSPQLVDQLSGVIKSSERVDVNISQIDVGPPVGMFGVQVYGEDSQKTNALAADIRTFLEKHEVTRPDGSKVKVEKVQAADPGGVTRKDGRKFVSVHAEFAADDTTALVTLAQNDVEKAFPAEKIASYGLPSDTLQFDFGEESENQESFKTMLIAFPILLIAMYILLAVQFRSGSQPLLIFMAIPFSIFGVMAGLYLTDNPFSFFTLIGVFALLGISVNNTILLTDFANQARAAGNRPIEAIARALEARFRPLITTSLTSVVALLPLALTDPFWESLAVTLIFGLLSSTILVVIAFPYYYLGLSYLQRRISFAKLILWVVGLASAGGLASVLNAPLGIFLLLYVLATLLLTRFWKRI